MDKMNIPQPTQLTLGTVQLGMSYGIVGSGRPPEQQDIDDILDMATESGIGWLDTARAYGNSEERIGAWIAKRTGGAEIVTKVPRLPADIADGYDWVRTHFAASLAALGVERVAILMVHHAPDMLVPGVHRAMSELVAEGRVAAIGVSAYDPEQVWPALDLGGIGALQIPANLIDRRMSESGVLAACREGGITVFCRSVYLQGLLVTAPDRLPAQFARLAPALAQLDGIATRANASRAALALAAASSLDGVSSLVVGVETRDQLAHTLSAWRQTGAFTSADLRAAVAAVEDLPAWIADPRQWRHHAAGLNT